MDILAKVSELFQSRNQKQRFRARQLLFSNSPLSKLVELYLYNNEGAPQILREFPMMRPIYDNLPKKLLLKCSRKTLKSTLISNIITLNMVRYPDYKMMYVGPNEQFTKYFSHNYLAARFESPPLKRIVSGLSKNDVFEKELEDTHSNVILKYASDDATRTRGPATDHNIHDEVQDMLLDILPIIAETMAISKIKREIFAGTPLTTDNTITALWNRGNQLEWAMKCTGCNHWNTLTEDNNPIKMIQKHGFSCSKCSKVLDSSQGCWVDANPGDREIIGFHLAQPLIPYYNASPEDWKDIYQKCFEREYSMLQVYNEVLGLPYDEGAKDITEQELKALCILGPMNKVFERRQHLYRGLFMGVDWGINPSSSRTVGTLGGVRDDGIIEIFWSKIFKDVNYEANIQELASVARKYSEMSGKEVMVAADSGPDAIRGAMLGNYHNAYCNKQATQLVSYRDSKYIQYTEVPPDATDWHQTRWCLHRSDTMGFTFRLLKKGQILFPDWEDMKEHMSDILCIFKEVKEDNLKAKILYCHPDNKPDDFFHTLSWVACQAHVWGSDPYFHCFSSSYNKMEEIN
jgi:hypothetical protein